MEIILSKHLNTNKSLSLLIHFLCTLKNDFQDLTEKEISDLSIINHQLQNYASSKRVAKILTYFCNAHNQKNYISASNKYVNVLFKILDNVEIDLTHQGRHMPLIESMLHLIENSPNKMDDKMLLMAKFFKKISSKTNINQLKVNSNEKGKLMPFIEYFLDINQPTEIIHILFKNYKQYQIDFTENNMYFLRHIVAHFHNAERLTTKERMFSLLDVDLLTEKFSIHESIHHTTQLFNRVLINSNFKFIEYVMDNHEAVIKKTEIHSSDIMRNPFLNVNEKVQLLNEFKCKELIQYDLFYSLLISHENNEDNIKTFLTHCYKNYNINHILDNELNHLICDYNMLNNPNFLEPFILTMNIEHLPNTNQDYPIHVLLKNNHFEAKKATIRLLNYFKDKGVNLHTLDKEGNNALHLALNTHQNNEVIQFLIDEQISLSQKNKAGIQPYSYLIKKSNLDNSLLEKATSYYEKEILDNQISHHHTNKKHKI
jgi:hypothetical protein